MYQVNLQLSDAYSASDLYSFDLEVIVKSPITVNTNPPRFTRELAPLNLSLGDYHVLVLPPVIEDDGDTVIVSIPNFISSGLYKLINWNQGTRTIVCNPMYASQVGTYNITILLTNKNVKRSLSKTYFLLINISLGKNTLIDKPKV